MNGTDRKQHPTARPRLGSRASAKLAGGLAAAALALPAAAAGYTVPGDPTGAGTGGATHASTSLVLHRDGSKAVPFVGGTSAGDTSTGGGFDWGDAAIGAGAVLGIAALGGAGMTLRRRTVGSPTVLSGS